MRHEIDKDFYLEMITGGGANIKVFNSLGKEIWCFPNIRVTALPEQAVKVIKSFLHGLPAKWLQAAKIGRQEYLEATRVLVCRKHEYVYEQIGSECMHWCKNCKKLFRSK